MKWIFFLFFAAAQLFSGCSSDTRHKVVGDQLTVYFDDLEEEEFAEKIAIFWKESKFVTGKKQDLKIAVSGKEMSIFMISKEPKEVKNISFDEQKMLRDLEASIQKEVFPKFSVYLVIANDKFEPILTLD